MTATEHQHSPATGPARPCRVLLFADTHLGIDLPEHPRVERRRRGEDFFANFEEALAPARRGEVDLVVHGGDLFDHGRVSSRVVERAFAPLAEIASTGIPVFVVPGNHERSQIPFPVLGTHPNIHVFRSPRTITVPVGPSRVAVSGLPFIRGDIRVAFRGLVEQTQWRQHAADIRLLCMHQAVEGACVGMQNFTFRNGRDVIRGQDLPGEFAAVLSGHIHRGQRLTHDLRGARLPAPVFYPGSVERTSFVERQERKGYVLLEVAPTRPGTDNTPSGTVTSARMRPLRTRPMHDVLFDATPHDADSAREHLHAVLSALPIDAVVRVRVSGDVTPALASVLQAERLRLLAPRTMNVDLAAQYRKP